MDKDPRRLTPSKTRPEPKTLGRGAVVPRPRRTGLDSPSPPAQFENAGRRNNAGQTNKEEAQRALRATRALDQIGGGVKLNEPECL